MNTVSVTGQFNTSVEELYRLVATDFNRWWDKKYSLHPTPPEVFEVMNDYRVGGTLYEKWEGDSGALWGHIISIKTNEWFEIVGPMGVKGPPGGIIEILFSPSDTGSSLTVNHSGAFVSEKHLEAVATAWKGLISCIKQSLFD